MEKTTKLPREQYAAWIVELKQRWRATQIKAAVAVNSALIQFYWELGRDINEKYSQTSIYGKNFFAKLSADLKAAIPDVRGLSAQNLRYCLHFYELYGLDSNFQQVVGKFNGELEQQVDTRGKLEQVSAKGEGSIPLQPDEAKLVPQIVEQLVRVPWGHHVQIIDKCKGDRDKALFYVRRTIQNGWSRSVLLN